MKSFAFSLLGLAAVGHAVSTCSVRTSTVTIYEDQVSSTFPTSKATLATTLATSLANTQATTLATVVKSSKTSALTATRSQASTSAASAAGTTSVKATSSTAAKAAATSSASAASSVSASAASTASSATGTSSSSGSSVSGTSTFYGGNVSGGTCSFSTYTLPSGLYGTAYSGEVWNSAAQCGRCVNVTGPNGNTIKAMIVDQCPECNQGHLDLFQDAFAQLGSISAGTISTSYTFVECGITSPIILHSKTGTSSYWFSMQVVNSNLGVTKLEVSTDSGSTWQSTTRTNYNFFEKSSGFGTETVSVRITSTSGSTLVVSNVSGASDAQTTASSNF